MLYDDFKKTYISESRKHAKMLRENADVEKKENKDEEADPLNDRKVHRDKGRGFGKDDTRVVAVAKRAPFALLEKDPEAWAEEIKAVILDMAEDKVEKIEYFQDSEEETDEEGGKYAEGEFSDVLSVTLKNGANVDLIYDGSLIGVYTGENRDKNSALLISERPWRGPSYSNVLNTFLSYIVNWGKHEELEMTSKEDEEGTNEKKAYNKKDIKESIAFRRGFRAGIKEAKSLRESRNEGVTVATIVAEAARDTLDYVQSKKFKGEIKNFNQAIEEVAATLEDKSGYESPASIFRGAEDAKSYSKHSLTFDVVKEIANKDKGINDLIQSIKKAAVK